MVFGIEIKQGSEIADKNVNIIEDVIIKSPWIVSKENPINNGLDISIYPNPCTDRTQISFKLFEEANVCIRLYNVSGVLMRTISYKKLFNEGVNKINLEIEDMLPGVYLYSFEANGNTTRYSASRNIVIIN